MRQITYDLMPGEPASFVPRPGDYLECRSRRTRLPTGTVYRVASSRQVRSRVAPGERHALLVEPVREVPPAVREDVSCRTRILPLFWHPRRRAVR